MPVGIGTTEKRHDSPGQRTEGRKGWKAEGRRRGSDGSGVWARARARAGDEFINCIRAFEYPLKRPSKGKGRGGREGRGGKERKGKEPEEEKARGV
ncbi:hypothetical protein Mp_5g01470 [Marchantia polymorpha subsp. ruderalis]|uniref:Uncharacterized protein n=2 Tax=Marchantia polymorpha TaxID=3197 RepID=A0AAF6BDT5_MARPO|nr:hypothetical protein MARPO_0175s0010 [Marchantia polymorpha]BBN10169.1 hypothetical protein Mp_5g01470 [Marchantia polymorpha subsp. ruderalis]|eukprot:PTQ28048.1 hypothetical protein MARPO_0175s0010 [Marchantia polymorpha]